MAMQDQQDGSDVQETERGLDRYTERATFHDTPTSDEWGPTIAFFDAILWVSDYLAASEEWNPELAENPPERVIAAEGLDIAAWRNLKKAHRYRIWNEMVAAERRIRRYCESGRLAAHGFEVRDGAVMKRPEPVPAGHWPSLIIDTIEGQPDSDKATHGGREYGQALWLDHGDANRPASVAWTALHFQKADILKHWPATARLNSFFSKRTATEALVTYLKQFEAATFGEAHSHLKAEGRRIGEKAFRDIWPEAREIAGLPRHGKSGAPKKSPRTK